ncbi:hypothetical protein NUM_13010 [Actinocatenispora comari]|uniref:Uncharacterized protein n=1 Tax=Actinocatenispora comari TaxID=2807577 RepID=A0A8J4EIG0_9ACTN|nr:hypothetical protein NUM_13010 [Actinocatenispora comari]
MHRLDGRPDLFDRGRHVELGTGQHVARIGGGTAQVDTSQHASSLGVPTCGNRWCSAPRPVPAGDGNGDPDRTDIPAYPAGTGQARSTWSFGSTAGNP